MDDYDTNLWRECLEVVKVLLEDVSLLDAGVDGKRLCMVDVLQRVLVCGGLTVDVHGKIGALHLAGR